MKKQNVQNMEIERKFCELYKVKIEPDWSKFFTEDGFESVIEDQRFNDWIDLTPDFKITFFEEKIVIPIFQKNELDEIEEYPCIVDSMMWIDEEEEEEEDEWGNSTNEIFPKVNGIGDDYFGEFFRQVNPGGSNLLYSRMFYTSLDFSEFQKWFEDSIEHHFWGEEENYPIKKIPSNSIKSVKSFIEEVVMVNSYWEGKINPQLLDALEKEDEDYVKIKIISFQKS